MVGRDAVFVFLFLFVLATAISNAGLFLNDEWMNAAALDQIAEGHQFKTSEGKYGFYANGTPTVYMAWRNESIMYPIAFPLTALPVHYILSLAGENFRAVVVVTWIFALLAAMYILSGYIDAKTFLPVYAAASILGVINLFLYSPFPWNGQFIPNEVVSILITNSILFAAFGAIIYLITKEMFKTTSHHIFATIATLSCSSALFWCGTGKDHIFIILLMSITALSLIRYSKRNAPKYIALASFTSSIILWARPEIGVGVITAVGLITIYFAYKTKRYSDILYLAAAGIGISAFLINNLIISGSIFVTPFMAANVGYHNIFGTTYIGNISTYANKSIDPITHKPYARSILGDIFKTMFLPESGAAGVIVLAPLLVTIIFPILYRRKYKLDSTEAMLILLAFSTLIIYAVRGSLILQNADYGIFPDQRYVSQIYAFITLVALSIVHKVYDDINYKKMIKNTLLFFALILSIMMCIVGMFTSLFPEEAQFNVLVTSITFIAIAFFFISTINDYRLKSKSYYISIPLLIATPLAWNIVSIFMYNSVKLASYPHLIPIVQYLHGLVF